eukprot:COSAG06_NODE_3100_length_5860_cov_286.024996_3_plen_67_part_00
MRYVSCCTYRGLKTTMSGFLYADYYGRKHVGSIQALDSMSGIAGTVRAAFRAITTRGKFSVSERFF